MTDYTKDIIKILTSHNDGWTPYDMFCDWVKAMALSISNSTDMIRGRSWNIRENEYMQTVGKYKERANDFVEMTGMLTLTLENNITDLLGYIYMAAGLGNKYTGQFFTPFHISELNAQIIIPKEITEPIMLNEPSTGGGGAIIAAAKVMLERNCNPQKYLEFVAQDLDWKAVYMTYVQTSLLGLRGIVFQGDTLTEPFEPRKYSHERIFCTPAKKGMI
jgi:hypothetical protein